MPEGEEEWQEIENLFEKIMKENLAKEIDFQEVQEAQRVPKKLDPRRNTQGHIIITLPKIKGKERILKAVREKERVICPLNFRSNRKTMLEKVDCIGPFYVFSCFFVFVISLFLFIYF